MSTKTALLASYDQQPNDFPLTRNNFVDNEFEPKFTLNLLEERLLRKGVAIHLPPKAVLMLLFFVTNPSRLLTKAAILDAVWPNRFVCEALVKDYVRLLRSKLDDDYRNPNYIETVHRRGYRFIGNITLIQDREMTKKNESYEYAKPPHLMVSAKIRPNTLTEHSVSTQFLPNLYDSSTAGTYHVSSKVNEHKSSTLKSDGG